MKLHWLARLCRSAKMMIAAGDGGVTEPFADHRGWRKIKTLCGLSSVVERAVRNG